MRNRSSIRHMAEYAVAWPWLRLLETLPLPAAQALCLWTGRMAFRLLPRERQWCLKQMQLAFGSHLTAFERKQLGRAVFEHHAKTILEILRMDADWLHSRVQIRGEKNLESLRRVIGRRPVIVVSGHLGNFEIIVSHLRRLGLSGALISRPLDNPYLERKLQTCRERYGGMAVSKGMSIRHAIRSLQEGVALGIAVDQNEVNGGVFVDFLGVQASTARGAAALALKLDAVVYPIVTYRASEDNHCIVIDAPIEVVRGGEWEHDLEVNTARFVKALERHVLEHPEQFHWQHPRWKTRPDGSAWTASTPISHMMAERVGEDAIPPLHWRRKDGGSDLGPASAGLKVTRLLAITQELNDSVTRYRLGAYASAMRHAGICMEVLPWPRDEQDRLAIIERAADFDAVVVVRRLLSLRHVRLLRRAARWLAFDFDEWITRRDPSQGMNVPSCDKVFQFRAMVKACDVVTAGNYHLEELAASYAPATRIVVIPTTIDLDRYATLATAEFDRVLGWIGQTSTHVYLERINPALRSIHEQSPSIVVRCISNQIPKLHGVNVELRPWSESSEVRDLSTLDIGMAPLTDEIWSRGKCGLRLLQYLAAGVPAIASPVGVQDDIVRWGGAIAASNLDQWQTEIRRLRADKDLRFDLARRGRKLVETRFQTKQWAPVILREWCRVRDPSRVRGKRSA